MTYPIGLAHKYLGRDEMTGPPVPPRPVEYDPGYVVNQPPPLPPLPPSYVSQSPPPHPTTPLPAPRPHRLDPTIPANVRMHRVSPCIR